CTVTGNSAVSGGGGAFGGTLNNCIVYFNTAPDDANHYQDSSVSTVLNFCCTTPLPTDGVGNFTNAPLFFDQAGGNLRLQSNSPCINAGNNSYAPRPTDLDGNPRIVGGTVDIGAYELQPLNHAPVAVARVFPRFQIFGDETNLVVLSPNNTHALVFFDGSLSTDLDNDPLQYFWFEAGQTNVFGIGIVATN